MATRGRKSTFGGGLRNRSDSKRVSSLFRNHGGINSTVENTFIPKSQVQIKRLEASDLVIIDDLMYIAVDQREANLFFQLIHFLYERSSIILTSNKIPEEWAVLVGDEGVMTAILDRLLHRVEVINTNEDSYRMKYWKTIF